MHECEYLSIQEDSFNAFSFTEKHYIRIGFKFGL